MKKRILDILLILCMVLALCPVTAFAETPEERYSLIIKFDHGTYLGCTGSYNKGDDYKSGDKYDITKDFSYIVDFAPYVFVATKNTTGTFTDSDMVAEFIFAMPEYSIDIEVSGYAVGNTPADCKIENITSTIPDVSFDPEDKNDVLDIVWIDVDAGKTMSDTDVFQAEGTYEIDVTLAHKDGISVLPLATVDGKLCRHCRQWDAGTFLVACYMEKPASQYTITYDGGEDSEGSIASGVKTPRVDFTLSNETFTRDGYVQTGWVDANDNFYELGGTYSTDADVTLYPVYDELITLTVPFTTTVKLGGNGEPGETTFDLAIIGANAGEETYADVTVSGSVTTDGAGDYEGKLTLTGPSQQLENMLCEGALVQQVDGGEEGWTYDDTVWGLLLTEVVALASTDDAAPEYTVLILPVTCEETDDGMYYDLEWDADPVDQMSFTNTYTKSTTEPTDPTENNPGTGDNSNPALWFALFSVSAAGVIGTGVYNKRRRSSRAK